MIANRLSVLLAERQLSIKDVVEGTGLSRNTISNLINKNMSNSINLQTLNSLCMYLEIEPKDFFVYSAFDLNFRILDEENVNSDFYSYRFLFRSLVKHNEDSYSIDDEVYIVEDTNDYKHVKNKTFEVIFNEDLFNGMYRRDDKKISRFSVESIEDLINDELDIMFQKRIKKEIENITEKNVRQMLNLKEININEVTNTPNFIYINFEFPWSNRKRFYIKDNNVNEN